MADEIEYNAFYHILQNKYRKEYENALSQCWTICIPCNAALRGIKIDKEFVDIHLLKPSFNSLGFFTSGADNSFQFEVGSETITLDKAPFSLEKVYIVNIMHIENGYNKEFHQYKIFIIDKPLSPKYISKSSDEDSSLQLDKKISSLSEANDFLSKFSLERVNSDIELIIEDSSFCNAELDDIQEKLHELVSSHWVFFLQTQSLELQRDARFQKCLTTALENYIMNNLYDTLFPIICVHHKHHDEAVMSQIQALTVKGVTADQLGAPEDFAVPLPAAVVELASLDSFCAPVDKLFCLRTTIDLILAEVKGALIDAQSLHSAEAELPELNTDNLVPLLMSVIIQAKPLHMFSNLYYVENFQWTLSPKDAMSFSVVTFQAAVHELLNVKPNELKARSEKLHRELGLKELIKVTGEVGEHFERSGERSQIPVTTLDRELERITTLIEASTQDLSSTSLNDELESINS